MKIYSEKTCKNYKTVDECLEAEKKFDEAKAKKDKEKAELVEKRKVRAKEVEDAYSSVRDAEKHYVELRNQFVKDFGSYHMTFSSCDCNNLFDKFWDNFFNIF